MTNTQPSSADSITGILRDIENFRDKLINVTQTLVRIPSPTPPSDTRATVTAVAGLLSDLEGVEIGIHTSEPPIDNLVATVRAARPGKRLVLNGHLDTFPAGNRSDWRDDPYSGILRQGKIYGRGSGDMKGGVACMLQTFRYLAQKRDLWAGELVLTLAGDEESMGTLGTGFLLDTVPEARGDAMLNADIGSPIVPRIGEKGMIWMDVFATGKPAHGAHVHRGVNAIDTLRAAMDELARLRSFGVNTPDDVARVVSDAKEVSEPLGGDGEADILQTITVNFGRLEGGQTANLVADRAEVNVDIRLPMGTSLAQIEAEISRLLEPIPGIGFKMTRQYEPSWTQPDEPIVRAVIDACERVLAGTPKANMRIGASDARLYRAAGIPAVVCGLTPHNLGGPDEYVEVDELVDVTKIHILSALGYLSPV